MGGQSPPSNASITHKTNISAEKLDQHSQKVVDIFRLDAFLPRSFFAILNAKHDRDTICASSPSTKYTMSSSKDPHAVGDTKTYLRHPMSLSPSDPSLVKTQFGLVRGSVNALSLLWLNVPYACPPVGDLRWKPPVQPVPSWKDVRDARKQGWADHQEMKFATAYDDETVQLRPNLTGSASQKCLNCTASTLDRGRRTVLLADFRLSDQFRRFGSRICSLLLTIQAAQTHWMKILEMDTDAETRSSSVNHSMDR